MKRLILGIFLVVWWCGNLVCAQDIAVKTNLLYWATSTPNIGFEFGLGKRTTLDLVGGYNPWTLNKDDNKKIKHWMVMPEFRYWLCERFNGHFSVFIPGLQNTISAVCGFPSKISLPKSIVMRGGPPGSVFLMVIRGF